MNAEILLKRLNYWRSTFRVLPDGAESELEYIISELEEEVHVPKKAAQKRKKAKKTTKSRSVSIRSG